MKSWELVFGDSLRKAVLEINLTAIQQHTVEAYNKAIQRLHGIDYLLTTMGFSGDVAIRMMNQISKLEMLKERV